MFFNRMRCPEASFTGPRLVIRIKAGCRDGVIRIQISLALFDDNLPRQKTVSSSQSVYFPWSQVPVSTTHGKPSTFSIGESVRSRHVCNDVPNLFVIFDEPANHWLQSRPGNCGHKPHFVTSAVYIAEMT